MARGKSKIKRNIAKPDHKYQSTDLSKFINKVMLGGKKTKAENLIYKALDILSEKTKKKPIEVFESAIKEAAPLVEVRSKRIGGAAYQVPIEVSQSRGKHLAMTWLIKFARARKEKSFDQKLAAEIMDLMASQGATSKKKEETHKMAEANKALAYLAKLR